MFNPNPGGPPQYPGFEPASNASTYEKVDYAGYGSGLGYGGDVYSGQGSDGSIGYTGFGGANNYNQVQTYLANSGLDNNATYKQILNLSNAGQYTQALTDLEDDSFYSNVSSNQNFGVVDVANISQGYSDLADYAGQSVLAGTSLAVGIGALATGDVVVGIPALAASYTAANAAMNDINNPDAQGALGAIGGALGDLFQSINSGAAQTLRYIEDDLITKPTVGAAPISRQIAVPSHATGHTLAALTHNSQSVFSSVR